MLCTLHVAEIFFIAQNFNKQNSVIVTRSMRKMAQYDLEAPSELSERLNYASYIFVFIILL